MKYDKLNPSHQFSLRRMSVAIAILSAVLAITTAFPIFVAQNVTFNLLLYAPAGIVVLFATWLSKNRVRAIALLLTGAFAGWLASPRVLVNWGSYIPTFWDWFIVDFTSLGLWTLGGTLAAAAVNLVVDLLWQPKT